MKSYHLVLPVTLLMAGCFSSSSSDSKNDTDNSSGSTPVIPAEISGPYSGAFDDSSSELFIASDGRTVLTTSQHDGIGFYGTSIVEESELVFTGDVHGITATSDITAHMQINDSLSGDYSWQIYTSSALGTLSYNKDSRFDEQTTTLDKFVGSWSTATGQIIEVSDVGVIIEYVDSERGCTETGLFELIDPAQNEFSVTLNSLDCSDPEMNNAYQGIGYFINDTSEQEQIKFTVFADDPWESFQHSSRTETYTKSD